VLLLTPRRHAERDRSSPQEVRTLSASCQADDRPAGCKHNTWVMVSESVVAVARNRRAFVAAARARQLDMNSSYVE